MRADKHNHNNCCEECGRTVVRCPGCGEPFPNATPGYLDEGGWHTGPRPVPAPRSQAVVAAERVLERAQQAYDAAHREWELAASRRHQAEQESARTRRPAVTRTGDMIELGGIDRAELRRLSDLEAAARERRDEAGAEVVAARLANRAATQAA